MLMSSLLCDPDPECAAQSSRPDDGLGSCSNGWIQLDVRCARGNGDCRPRTLLSKAARKKNDQALRDAEWDAYLDSLDAKEYHVLAHNMFNRMLRVREEYDQKFIDTYGYEYYSDNYLVHGNRDSPIYDDDDDDPGDATYHNDDAVDNY